MGWKVGGRFRRKGTCVYLWLIHTDVWQKPTQYCKTIILQLKINLKNKINGQDRCFRGEKKYADCTEPFDFFSWTKAHFYSLFYLTGSTALTKSFEHGRHQLEGWWLSVIAGIRFGHAVTDVFWVCCCLDLDSFASLRWTVTVTIPVAFGFKIQKQQPAQNRPVQRVLDFDFQKLSN